MTKTVLDAIGAHCVAEKIAGRPVPASARVSPGAFQPFAAWAFLFEKNGATWLEMATAAGVVRVISDPTVTGDDIRYEVTA